MTQPNAPSTFDPACGICRLMTPANRTDHSTHAAGRCAEVTQLEDGTMRIEGKPTEEERQQAIAEIRRKALDAMALCPAGGQHTPGTREDANGNERPACAECGALPVDPRRLAACTVPTPHRLDECDAF